MDVVEGGRELIIRRVEEVDRGEYTCTAHIKYLPVSQSHTLDILRKYLPVSQSPTLDILCKYLPISQSHTLDNFRKYLPVS